MVLYVVGRKSGKVYTIPMAYLEHDGALPLGSGFPWARTCAQGTRSASGTKVAGGWLTGPAAYMASGT